MIQKIKNIIVRKENEVAGTLADCRGEGYVDSVIKMLIACVLGALLLFSLYTLFNGTIIPYLEDAVDALFGYEGALNALS